MDFYKDDQTKILSVPVCILVLGFVDKPVSTIQNGFENFITCKSVETLHVVKQMQDWHLYLEMFSACMPLPNGQQFP